MGVHNRITREKYNRIKKRLKTPTDDERVATEFSVSSTTCRNIRNTKNYQEYCERVFRFHNHPANKVKIRETAKRTRKKKGVFTPGEIIFIVFMVGMFTLFSLLIILEASK